MLRIVFALLAAGCGFPAGAQSLHDAVESAWARQPAARGVAPRNELFRARRDAAGAWLPAPPSIGFSHRTDQIDRDRGAREWESELTVPLWALGAKARAIEHVDAEHTRFDAQRALAKWRLAGEVRDSLWQAIVAGSERTIAERKAEEAKLLATDVVRRLRAGDVAPVDANQARAAAQLAESLLVEAKMRYARSLQQFRLLTGLTTLPAETETTPLDTPAIDVHPQLVAAAKAIEAARARLSQASTVTRDSPELAVGLRSERMMSGERFDNSVRVGIRIPFGTEGRNRPRIAEANAELIEATAELSLIRQQIESEIAAAQSALVAAQSIEVFATERLRLASENRDLYDRAFRLGNLDLPQRLRAENEHFDALLAKERARAEIGRAIARLNQSMGRMP
jgi:outer membrane protein, heavy metal efflux system